MLNMNDLKGIKISITGGSGFLGHHVTPALLASGANITCLCRKTTSGNSFPAGINLVPGDCATGEGLEDLLKDSHIFIHMASLLFGLGWQDYLQANARACQNIARAFTTLPKAQRPARIIFISSLAAAGPCATPPGINESAMPGPVSAYGWSKLLCENILRSHLQDRLLILRPPVIYGSWDRGLLPMFRSAKSGFGINPGAFRKFPLSIIHADDMATAIIRACARNITGLYHLSDGSVYDMDMLCAAMAAAQGRYSLRMLRIPLPVMAASAMLSTATALAVRKILRLAMRPPQWNMDKYREARQQGWLADASNGFIALDFQPRISLKEGMEEAVRGYRAEGWL